MPYRDPEIAKKKSRERYLKNREKVLERSKTYLKENGEKIRQYQKRWREENREEILEYKKGYYKSNRETLLKKSSEYQRNNKEGTRERVRRYRNTDKGRDNANSQRNHRRRREKHASLGRSFRKQVLEIYKQSKEISRATGVVHEVDHIIPLLGRDVCGLHVPWNLQIIPREENRAKTNRVD